MPLQLDGIKLIYGMEDLFICVEVQLFSVKVLLIRKDVYEQIFFKIKKRRMWLKMMNKLKEVITTE